MNVRLKCNLKDILKQRKISVNQFAHDIDERRQTVADLVNNVDMNNRRIPASLVARMKAYLNVSFDELFEVVEVNSEEAKEDDPK